MTSNKTIGLMLLFTCTTIFSMHNNLVKIIETKKVKERHWMAATTSRFTEIEYTHDSHNEVCIYVRDLSAKYQLLKEFLEANKDNKIVLVSPFTKWVDFSLIDVEQEFHT